MLMDIKASLLGLQQAREKDENSEYIASPAFRVCSANILHLAYWSILSGGF